MAYFESMKCESKYPEGAFFYHCPACGEEIVRFPQERKNPFVKKVTALLGRTGVWAMMAYDPREMIYGRKYSTITDILLGGDGALAINLATLLNAAIIPNNPEKIRMIRIRDVLNPRALADDIYYDVFGLDDWAFYNANGEHCKEHPITFKDGRRILFDDRYVVIMEDHQDGGEIVLTIFAIPPKED